MRKLTAFLTALIMLMTCCYAESTDQDSVEFSKMSNPDLLPYMEDAIYEALLDNLGDDYFVENVEAIYISDEYLEELAFNSQSNLYFGFSLDELEQQFQGQRYVFTLSETNETTVKTWEPYDDTMERVIRNVAIGSGVILVCVTVSVVTAGAGAPAVSMIFAMSAKTGTICALSSGTIGAAAAGGLEYLHTGDKDKALKAAALKGSEGFMWGAIIGSVSGGVGEYGGLRGARMNGLSMNDAATIQKESKLPLDFIKNFHSVDEYNIYSKAGLSYERIGGSFAYTQDVDLKSVITDQYGKTMTNAERITQGLSPVDPSGVPYELHHIGQMPDSPLAILSKAEHMSGGNNTILHFRTTSDVEHGAAWAKQVGEFWGNYLAKANPI